MTGSSSAARQMGHSSSPPAASSAASLAASPAALGGSAGLPAAAATPAASSASSCASGTIEESSQIWGRQGGRQGRRPVGAAARGKRRAGPAQSTWHETLHEGRRRAAHLAQPQDDLQHRDVGLQQGVGRQVVRDDLPPRHLQAVVPEGRGSSGRTRQRGGRGRRVGVEGCGPGRGLTLCVQRNPPPPPPEPLLPLQLHVQYVDGLGGQGQDGLAAHLRRCG
jgi:hypothetical protein